MKQMDPRMARGAERALKSGFKPIECTVHTQAGDLEAFIIGASRNLLTIEHEGDTATVKAEFVSVEDEVAETLRAHYEQVTASIQAARDFAMTASQLRGSYSAGKLGFRAR